MGRFIQESPNFPFQVSVVNKREVGRPDKERGIWERRGQGRCKGRKAGICLPWKQERSRGWKQRLGEAPEEACNAAEGRISLGKQEGCSLRLRGHSRGRGLREQAEVLLPARGGGVWHQLRQPRGKGRILE